MMKFARTLFALLMMALVAAVLILATVNWMEHGPGEVKSAIETTETPAVELVETGSAALDATLTRP